MWTTEQRKDIASFLATHFTQEEAAIIHRFLTKLREVSTMSRATKAAITRQEPLPEEPTIEQDEPTPEKPATHANALAFDRNYPVYTALVRASWGDWTVQFTFSDLPLEKLERKLMALEQAGYVPCVSPDRAIVKEEEEEDDMLPTRHYTPQQDSRVQQRRHNEEEATEPQRAFLKRLRSERWDDPRLTKKIASDLIEYYTKK